MTQIERNIEIERSSQDIFELLTDLDRVPEWATTVLENHDTPSRPIAKGQKFGQTLRIAGRNLSTQWEVTEFDPGRRIAYAAAGPAGARLEMTQRVEPLGDTASRVELQVDYDLPGGVLGDAIDKLYVERRNEREAEHSLQNLKELLEGNSQP